MAFDDTSDRTEQATPRRREEAREEGQVARSTDLTAAVSLVAGLLLLRTLGPRMLDHLLGMTAALGGDPPVRPSALWPWIAQTVWGGAQFLLPFLGALLVATAVCGLAQSGLLLTWKNLAPKPERLSPVSGLKRLFSSDSLTRLGLGLCKVAVVATIAYYTVADQLTLLLAAGGLHVTGVWRVGTTVFFDLALRIGIALLVLGILDYLIQRWKIERQLRMTKQEVRDELKKMEGDPLIKQRRRQLQTRLALQRIHAEVPKADVVVTNPTHYAAALRYDEATMGAPRLVAKGKDHLAVRIRQLAVQFRVPIVERPPLARALYAGVEVGREIPAAFYRAVAEVLSYVYQLSGKRAG